MTLIFLSGIAIKRPRSVWSFATADSVVSHGVRICDFLFDWRRRVSGCPCTFLSGRLLDALLYMHDFVVSIYPSAHFTLPCPRRSCICRVQCLRRLLLVIFFSFSLYIQLAQEARICFLKKEKSLFEEVSEIRKNELVGPLAYWLWWHSCLIGN